MKIYEHAFLQIKYPCFTRDLGPLRPSSRPLQSPGPVYEDRDTVLTEITGHVSLLQI